MKDIIRRTTFTAALALIAVGIVAAVRLPAADPGQPERVPIVYWASPAEYAAYQFICDGKREHEGVVLAESTATYSSSNGFQVLMLPIFDGWIAIKAAAERNKAVVDLANKLQAVSPADLKTIQNLVNSFTPTNPPSPQP